MKISTARTVVAVAVFGVVGVSLATHAATGTLSAIGYDSIALLCPVGALEVMLGAREFLLHPLLLLLLTVAVAAWVAKDTPTTPNTATATTVRAVEIFMPYTRLSTLMPRRCEPE